MNNTQINDTIKSKAKSIKSKYANRISSCIFAL